MKTFTGHAEWVRAVVPSADGKWLASCSSDQVRRTHGQSLMLTNGLQSARIWDASTGETKADFRGHDNVVEAAVFAPPSAYPAIRELAGIVSCVSNTIASS